MNSNSSFFGIETPTNKKKKGYSIEFKGEFRKIKPPKFNDESREASEAWLLDIERYF